MVKGRCHIEVNGFGDWLYYRFIDSEGKMVMEIYLLYTAKESVGDIITTHARSTNMGRSDGTVPENKD